MTTSQAQALLDTIIGQVFGYKNPLTIEQFMQKFTFDIRLPQSVVDAIDGSETWAQSTNPTKFIKRDNALEFGAGGAVKETDYLRPARKLENIQDIMTAWNETNFTTTERVLDSLNVSLSDNVSYSENVYRSQDVRNSKNVLLSDGLNNSEYMAGCQRSGDSTFCIRLDDSGECTNSFNVAWCGRVTNCFFMSDASDMEDSMFCTNVKGKRFCVANMQFDEHEYKRLRDIVARWILTS